MDAHAAQGPHDPHRPPDQQRAGGARAAHEAEGARDLQQRQHQLVGLRDRGDDADPRHRRRRGDQPDDAAHRRDLRGARDRRHQLLADDSGLPERCQQLPRLQRQPRIHCRARGRRRPADRLHADGRGVGLGRRRGDHIGHPRALPGTRAHRRRDRLPAHARQPARRAGVRDDLHGADVSLHRPHPRHGRRSAWRGSRRARSPTTHRRPSG